MALDGGALYGAFYRGRGLPGHSHGCYIGPFQTNHTARIVEYLTRTSSGRFGAWPLRVATASFLSNGDGQLLLVDTDRDGIILGLKALIC